MFAIKDVRKIGEFNIYDRCKSKKDFFFKFQKKSLRESQVIFNKIRIREQRIVNKEIFISLLIIILVDDKYTIIC